MDNKLPKKKTFPHYDFFELHIKTKYNMNEPSWPAEHTVV